MRRFISSPLAIVALFFLLPLAPVVLLVATIVDMSRSRHGLPTVRALSFLYQFLVLEFCAIVSAVGLWLVFGFGLFLRSKPSQRAHNAVEHWWIGQVAAAAQRSAHLVFDIPDDIPLVPGPLVVIGRHASYADAFLPALMLGAHRKMNLRYVLADELTWDPSLGIYGRRLPNVFVNRKTANERQLMRIADLGRDLGTNDAAVIFPEGQFLTPERKAKVVARLEAQDPSVAKRAEALDHLMPPRPAGTLALWTHALPEADVVVVGHVGLERLRSLGDIARNLPLTRPITVTAWRVPGHELPTDEDGRTEWLWQQWERLDAWIDSNTPAGSPASSPNSTPKDSQP